MELTLLYKVGEPTGPANESESIATLIALDGNP
jgi:hypothetical protein